LYECYNVTVEHWRTLKYYLHKYNTITANSS